MDIDDLKILLDVQRFGSLSQAARARDLDPSKLSRVLSNAEKELGFRLFQRTTRQLSATEEGRRYLDRIAPLVDELTDAATAGQEAQGDPQGALRITASVAFGEVWLLPRIDAMLRRYPGLSIDLRLSDAQLDLVGEGIDLAVRMGPQADSSLIATKLMETRYRVLAHPDWVEAMGSPSVPSDLSECDCVLMTLGAYGTRWQFRCGEGEAQEIRVSGRLRVSNALTQRSAVRRALGPGLLADWLTEADRASGSLVDLFPDWTVGAGDFESAVWLLYPSRAYMPRKTALFIEALKQSVV